MKLEATAAAVNDRIKLEPSWKAVLKSEFDQPYMKNLKAFLVEQYAKKKKIYPSKGEIFNAFNLTPFDKVKVVILGQDPYHGPDQAHGLCFSVKPGMRPPPSLQNIFKELEQEFHLRPPVSGDLTSWAKQGVLLLNATLTVEDGKAASHQNKGWETFTDQVIKALSEKRSGLVFMLWGSYAQKKAEIIDAHKHLILKSPHPSPLSAHRGFLGNGHFAKANAYLIKNKIQPIEWTLPQ